MALIIEVKVVPSAGKYQWLIDKTGKLKCLLKSPAERGLANHELIKNLAKTLQVTQQEVTIIAGETSRNKKIKIERVMTMDQLLAQLGIERQTSLIP